MARRSSSLASLDVAVSRELTSKYDVIKAVASSIADIEKVAAQDVAALSTLLTDAQDFTGITVVTGDTASWDPVAKVLTVPVLRGEKGDAVVGPPGKDGADGATVVGPAGQSVQGDRGEKGVRGAVGPAGGTGYTPVISFDVTAEGELRYDVTYTDSTFDLLPAEEW